jgi:hypothetical protein
MESKYIAVNDINFRNQNGSWNRSISLHDRLNIGEETACPSVTRDGMYLFNEHNGDIYWVDAGLIKELK